MKKIKSIISLMLCLIMTLQTINAVFVFAATDYDNHWAKSQITNLLNENIVSGYSDGSIKPDNNISRAEFVTLTNNLFKYSEKADSNFIDVNSEAWYADQFLIAKEARYLSGDDNGFANPDNNITRAEVCVIVSKVLNLEGVSYTSFTDDSYLPSWAKMYIGAMEKAEFINGYPDGSFGADKNITRAEAFTIIYNIMENINKENILEEDTTEETTEETTETTTRVTKTTYRARGGGGGSSSQSTKYYTVSFDNNFDNNDVVLSGDAVDIPSVTVKENSTIEKPEDPKVDGYTFLGWFKDILCTDIFSFTEKIVNDITLFAKWGKKEEPTTVEESTEETTEIVTTTEETTEIVSTTEEITEIVSTTEETTETASITDETTTNVETSVESTTITETSEITESTTEETTSSEPESFDFNVLSFSVDKDEIIVNETENVLFELSVDKEIISNNVYIQDEDGNTICQLNDEGSNSDNVANDNIYTGSGNISSNIEKYKEYSVFVNNTELCSLSVFFYTLITDEECKEFDNIIEEVENKKINYLDSEGYVREEDVPKVIKLVEDYAESKYLAGEIAEYSITDSSVIIKLNSGINYIFVPPVENRLSNSKYEKTVLGIGPTYTDLINTVHGSVIDSWLKDQFGYEDGNYIRNNAKFLSELNSAYKYESYMDESASVDMFKNIKDPAVIIFEGHGALGENSGSWLITDTKGTWNNLKTYSDDLKTERLALSSTLPGSDPNTTIPSGLIKFALSAKFVEKYIELDDTLVFLGACHSCQNDILANAFINKGASVVIGTDNAVNPSYEMMFRFMFFYAMTHEKDNGELCNVAEAMEYAINICGETDGTKNNTKFVYFNEDGGNFRFKKGNYKLSGSVINQLSETIEKVNIQISQKMLDGSFEEITSTTTNSKGEFTVYLEDGNYNITLSKEGYEDKIINNVEITDKNVNIAPIEMIANNIISGYVINENGEPIEDAEVVFSEENSDISYTAYTDAHGRYEMPNVKTNTNKYYVSVSAMAYESVKGQTMIINVGDFPFVTVDTITLKNYVLEIDPYISGVVVDENGNPMYGVSVSIYKDGNILKTLTTDAEGKFGDSLSKGEYIFAIYTPGYITYTTETINITTSHNFGNIQLEVNSAEAQLFNLYDTASPDKMSAMILTLEEGGSVIAVGGIINDNSEYEGFGLINDDASVQLLHRINSSNGAFGLYNDDINYISFANAPDGEYVFYFACVKSGYTYRYSARPIVVKIADGKATFFKSSSYAKAQAMIEDLGSGTDLKYMTPQSNMTSSQYNLVKNKAEEITAGLTDDYSKAKAIYEWIANNNIQYSLDNNTNEGQNPAVVLERGTASCYGYARLTQAMIISVGIPCAFIAGYCNPDVAYITDDNITDTPNHAWNAAYIDGRWVLIDSTWGNQVVSGIRMQGDFDTSLEMFSMMHRYSEILFSE